MAALDRPLAAGLSSGKGRWSEYTLLSRQIKQAGLLDRRHGWYAGKIGLNLALLAAGLVAFFLLGESWWQLVTAAYLAVVATQLTFVGHDAGHRQIFRSRRANDLAGLVPTTKTSTPTSASPCWRSPPPRPAASTAWPG